MKDFLLLAKALLLCLFFSLGCVKNDKKSDKKKALFLDYDVIRDKGIDSISVIEAKDLTLSYNTYYELSYVDNKIDSIVIHNPFGNSEKMKLKAFFTDSVCVFKTIYPFEQYGKLSNCYFVLNKDSATQYIEVVDGWDIRVIKADTSYGQFNMSWKSMDEANLEERFLHSSDLEISPVPSPARKINFYKNRLDYNFSFNNWMHYESR